MRGVERRLAVFCFGAAMLFGCGQESREPDDAIAPAGATTGGIAWDLASVEGKLRAAGLQPVRAAEPVRQPFMTVAGSLLNLGNGEVQIYIYGDASARAHDTHRLDPHQVAPPHMMVSWRMPPTLIVSDNLAAILLTHDAALRDHVRRALTHPSHGGT